MSEACRQVESALRDEMASAPGGCLPFARFMELALYHEAGGYYSPGGAARLGRKGDFFTSVSVGECFGFLLSYFVAECWRSAGNPGAFRMVEPGARDGQLGRDVHSGLLAHCPGAAEALQIETVDPGGGLFRSMADVPSSGTPGVLIANEVLDALPVHRVRFTGGEWRDVAVRATAAGFAETLTPPSPALAGKLAAIPTQALPDGYTTEVNLAQQAWLTEAAHALPRGHHLLVDYGHRAHSYYDPSRREGTLCTYEKHRSGGDPLEAPGSRDITAHVEWDSVASDARRAGLTPAGFADQHHALTRLATPWLKTLEGDAPALADPANRQRLRQFQTLSHPTLMGQQFQFLALTAGSACPAPVQRFAPKLDL